MELKNLKLAVIGLGYVGLPLALAFSKKRLVIGFDIKTKRIEQLKSGYDHTTTFTESELRESQNLTFSSNLMDLEQCNCFIVTVPTPIDANKQPDLTPLISATKTVSRLLKPNDLVIFESTVYPGATEEVCVAILEQYSGLKFNEGFYCGYSPERINPGDKEHRLTNIIKITSGSTPEVSDVVDALYRDIIEAGTHKAESIKVAEAAKVIENIQRDLNIALTNELAIIFHKLGIDTEAVLRAAGSKWNFLPFWPGLVGGHCIGVDPYYLTHKAEATGYHPQVILAGRRLNDEMSSYVASQLIKKMITKSIQIQGARILIMGLSFKENCSDLRNTKIVDVISELQNYQCNVDVYDPWVDVEDAQCEYGLNPIKSPSQGVYDAIVIAVAHMQFREMTAGEFRALGKSNHVLYDLKYVLGADRSDLRL